MTAVMTSTAMKVLGDLSTFRTFLSVTKLIKILSGSGSKLLQKVLHSKPVHADGLGRGCDEWLLDVEVWLRDRLHLHGCTLLHFLLNGHLPASIVSHQHRPQCISERSSLPYSNLRHIMAACVHGTVGMTGHSTIDS